MGTELNGFKPNIVFEAPKDQGGADEQKKREEREKKEKQFERWMGPGITKAREEMLNMEAATGKRIPIKERQERLDALDYAKAFVEAVRKSGLKVGSPEWKSLTDELRVWSGYQDSNESEEKKEPTAEPRKKSRFDVNSEQDLNKKMLDFRGIADSQMRSQMLGALARELYNNGHADWGNSVMEEVGRLQERAGASGIEGLPADLDNAAEWRKWVRTRLASLLDPFVGEVRGANDVFGVISEQTFMGRTNRQTVNGTNYLRSGELRDELVDGKRTGDGRIVEASELQVSQEIARLYADWRGVHGNLNALMSAIENGTYKMPDIKLTKKIFNGLKSEDGRDPEGGSKRVSEAMQLYWAMAHSKEPEGEEILRRNGLSGIRNIFDSQLSDAEIGEIRGKIAEKCGGAFYENLGLMYASFLGISSYGSDSTAPGIRYVDRMGTLIHTEVNFFDNDKDKYDVNKRKYRFFDDTVAKNLCVLRNGRAVRDASGKIVPLEIGVHTGNLQTLVEAKQPRAFYVLRERGSSEKYVIVKKIGLPGTDYAQDPNARFLALDTGRYEEVLFDDLVREGRLNEIDWGSSYDIFSTMKSRESDALAVYKMFKNLDDTIEKLTEAELIKRKDNFESALPQYNLETQKHVMYLWMYSLIAKNREAWTNGGKFQDLKYMLDDVVKQGLITEADRRTLYSVFDLNIYRDLFKIGKRN